MLIQEANLKGDSLTKFLCACPNPTFDLRVFIMCNCEKTGTFGQPQFAPKIYRTYSIKHFFKSVQETKVTEWVLCINMGQIQ